MKPKKKHLVFGLVLVFCSAFVFTDLRSSDSTEPLETMEEAGQTGQAAVENETPHFPYSPSSLGTGKPVLLIPDSTADVVAVFHPYDGTYQGDLINNSAGLFSTPVNAIQWRDYNIYVSDQVADSVFVYDIQGNYLSTYADASDGLNNIRGIAFRGNHLFVTSGDDFVAEFDGPHSRLPDFISDGSDPFDICFLPDGTSALSDIQGTDDNVRFYDFNGALIAELFKTNFPEQVTADLMFKPHGFLVTTFSDKNVTNFGRAEGDIYNVINLNNYGRGVYRLGNGNILTSGYDGVQEWDPASGALLTQIMTGSGWRFIEEAEL